MSDQHRKQGRVVILDAEDLERILRWSGEVQADAAHFDGRLWDADDTALRDYFGMPDRNAALAAAHEHARQFAGVE